MFSCGAELGAAQLTPEQPLDAAHVLGALLGTGWHLQTLQPGAARLPWPETPPQGQQ